MIQPIVAMVVAVARNDVIGRDGALPWHLSSDLKLFRRLTMGKPLVMGRRTFQSIGRPLEGRDNIVVTRSPDALRQDGIIVHATVEAALAEAAILARGRDASEIMVIGGAEIYAAALAQTDRVYWTEVDARPEGDTRFPQLDPAEWVEVRVEAIPQGPRDDYRSRLRVFERHRLQPG